MTPLRTYLLGAIPAHLRDPAALTPQARTVRSILLDEGPSDRVRMARILDLMRGEERLERDAFVWLKTALRGHYGIEYAATDLTDDEQVRFWAELSERFPGDAELGLIHADARLLAGDLERALDLFNRSFEQDPALIAHVGGEVGDMMHDAGGQPWMRYRLALLRRAVERQDADLVDELAAELREEHAEDAEVLAAVERALAGRG